MKHISLLSILILVIMQMSTINSANADQHSNQKRGVKDTISVAGFGEVSAEPDQAVIAVTVSAINADVNRAKKSADEKYKSVLDATKSQGILKTDIKLSGLKVQPEYQWRDNQQVLIGTRVNRSLSITINDIDKVAPLLQKLVEGNVSTIERVQTGFQNRAVLERKALTAAITDAKDKAQFLATQFDKTLGSAYTISEHSQSQPIVRSFNEGMVRAKSLSASSVPEEHFGTQKVRANVNVVFHAH